MTECTCGKIRYLTKSHAKAAVRRMKGRVGRLNAYRCPAGFWHIGHLPKDVTKGRISREQIRPREQPAAPTPNDLARLLARKTTA
jgi:GH24 family phage-related lysozyme (muramidase)